MAQMETSMLDQVVSPTITTTLVNVVLYTQDQWKLWIQQISGGAPDANIWTTIDPGQSILPEFIPKPRIPRYFNVKLGATNLSELDREEEDDFRGLQETNRVEDTKWVRETSALQSITNSFESGCPWRPSNHQYKYKRLWNSKTTEERIVSFRWVLKVWGKASGTCCLSWTHGVRNERNMWTPGRMSIDRQKLWSFRRLKARCRMSYWLFQLRSLTKIGAINDIVRY